MVGEKRNAVRFGRAANGDDFIDAGGRRNTGVGTAIAARGHCRDPCLLQVVYDVCGSWKAVVANLAINPRCSQARVDCGYGEGLAQLEYAFQGAVDVRKKSRKFARALSKREHLARDKLSVAGRFALFPTAIDET